MASEILVNVKPYETRVAHIEGQSLIELKIERRSSPTHVGSIFMGKITRVLPGMQACFVEIGLDRAAFLYVGDVAALSPEEESSAAADGGLVEEVPREGHGRPPLHLLPAIQDLVSEGQNILVQVTKDPLGTKGARITTHISLTGRYLVYMPSLEHIGVSRRIESEPEREKLRALVESLDPKGGVIVRTASEDARSEEIEADLRYLQKLWQQIQEDAQSVTAGRVFSEIDIELRAMRDMLYDDVSRVMIDDKVTFERAKSFVDKFMPQFSNRIALYSQTLPIFDLYDVELELARAMDRRVWLKSGGYIVIDEAEALVAIDINTGRFTGKKDLEDTIFKTNLEATKEIAHQLRIRNLGGIIIIDFIDMERPAHREMILKALEEELSKDRVRTKVTTMSDLGLVEMTRKRTRPSLTKALCEPCDYCDGKGYLKQRSTLAHEIFRDIEREVAFSTAASVEVRCAPELADWVFENEDESVERLEAQLGVAVRVTVEESFHREKFEIAIKAKKEGTP